MTSINMGHMETYNPKDESLFLKAARRFAKSNGLEILNKIDNGMYGSAYLTSDNTVIKITKDILEVVCASKAQENKPKGYVSIYNIASFGQIYAIHQEMLEIPTFDIIVEIEESINRMKNHGVYLSCGSSIDHEDDAKSYIESMSDFDRTLYSDITFSADRLFEAGGHPYDIHADNIAIKEGKFILFDQKDAEFSMISESEIRIEIMKIRKSTLSSQKESKTPSL